MNVRLTFVNGDNGMATVEIDGTPITLKVGGETEVYIPSTTKPLKDQSYHQKRIADSLETLIGGEGIDVKIGSKEIQSLKDWPSGGEFHNLSEEDVRRIVKEEMEEEPKVYYDEKPCDAPNGSISIDTNKDVVDVWVKKWTKV